jgi:hypothetical protein
MPDGTVRRGVMWYAHARLGWVSSAMLRRCSCVIGLAVMLVGLPAAQAADTTLTLACQGTTTETSKENAKPERHSMGIIVNFTAPDCHRFYLSARRVSGDCNRVGRSAHHIRRFRQK